MKRDEEKEIDELLLGLESLEDLQTTLINDQVSMESLGDKVDYLRIRQLGEIEKSLGLEGMGFQDVRDVFSAVGRVAVTMGKGFLKMLDTIHRWIDTTHLVRLKQLREQLKTIPEDEAKIQKGRMGRKRLAAALAISGDIPANFSSYAEGMVDFSRRTCNNVLPDLASMSRQIGQRLEAKKWMGLDAFNAEVIEIAKIIGHYKTPMSRYSEQDFLRLYPGNRSIFTTIKPRRPRREPELDSPGVRKVIEGLSATNVGIRKRSDAVSGQSDVALPILTVEQALELLDAAEIMLNEAKRVAQLSRSYAKDRVPSTFSMMISGFYHGVKRQIDDVWTAQDDGFDVIEGAHQGGVAVRHKPGRRNMLGSAVSTLSFEESSMESESDNQAENDRRAQMAVWVSRYMKLSLIDHQKTGQALVLLLVGVARSYLDYVEESLDYYT